MRRAAITLAVGLIVALPGVVLAGPVFGTTWTFETQLYDGTAHPDGPPPGPWIDEARWAYMTSAEQATYTLSDFALFDTFGETNFTLAWVMGTVRYPQVNTADAGIHPGGSTTCVVAWQVQDWSDIAQIEYSALKTSGGAWDGVGYQLLHWDATTSTMEILGPRAILPQGGTFGPLSASAAVGPGDYILFVLDNGDGNEASGDRTYPSIRITAVPEPMTLSLLGVGLLALVRRRRR